MVWTIKAIVSPVDRFVVRISGGRVPPPSSFAVPTLLLTTVGRRSGRNRTVPLVYLRCDDGYIVANARPPGERINPWVLNLRTAGFGSIRVRGEFRRVRACEFDEPQIERWWPDLVDVWPAFGTHYAASGERAVFGLKVING